MKIALADVQRNVANIANRDHYDPSVIFELLAAYGRSKSAITQLQSGQLNKAEDKNSVLQKDVVYFRTYPLATKLEPEVQSLYEDPLTERFKPRYVIATDLDNLAARDMVKGTTLSIKLSDIDDHLDFFYAWTGDEVVDSSTEAVADRRAADKMNELYVEIEKENRDQFVSNPNFRHELNVFFTRLLFCFFAEDTGIYQKNQFTESIKTYTQVDGSDLSWFFDELFKSLDEENKEKYSPPFKEFPYVNGSIFNTYKHSVVIPRFNAQSRHLILECGKQNWGDINPDIFGTMFQGVVDPAHRDENGMDYTSVPNIMKVIEPLFMDELREQFDKFYDNEKKLWALLNRISKIKVFDPACGSGNFLIIAYKELRKLQHAIIGRIDELKPGGLGAKIPSGNLLEVDHLYGIEIDDFARELAILSIFLAKHQMNMEFNKQFGTSLAIIPLIELKTIAHGNAARLDWQEVCPNLGHKVTSQEQSVLFELEGNQSELKLGETVYDEIYLIGNPPYKGSRKQSEEQKRDILAIAGNLENYKSLDYISIWFLMASRYIRHSRAQFCFVSTNSITQGEQVGLLWPFILDCLEISFAYTSFKWQNSARDNAGVTVIIVGVRNPIRASKHLYVEGVKREVLNISPYLSESGDVIVRRSSRPISKFMPKIDYGSFALDGGFLTLSEEERNELISQDSRAEKYIKEFSGSQELIQGKKKYCIWIDESVVDDAKSIKPILSRLEAVREWRSGRSGKDSQKNAITPWKFAWRNYKNSEAILFPIVSSERRQYVPIGYMGSDVIISNAALAVYDAEPWLFALLESKMHMAWIRTVCGKLKTDYRYSSTLGYNTFPINPLTESEKNILNQSARRILLARAAHPEKTLADMYDPDKMPSDLREAHDQNDLIVDRLYKQSGFQNEEERLAALFELYEKMTSKEKTK